MESTPKNSRVEYMRAWRAANKDKIKGISSRYYAKNREAVRARQRASYAADPERHRAYSRKQLLKVRYGLSVEEYGLLLAAQGGVCAICESPPDKHRLSVDHCHSSGKVRGLLCHSCNIGIGYFKDDSSRLDSAIAYLRKTK